MGSNWGFAWCRVLLHLLYVTYGSALHNGTFSEVLPCSSSKTWTQIQGLATAALPLHNGFPWCPSLQENSNSSQGSEALEDCPKGCLLLRAVHSPAVHPASQTSQCTLRNERLLAELLRFNCCQRQVCCWKTAWFCNSGEAEKRKYSEVNATFCRVRRH